VSNYAEYQARLVEDLINTYDLYLDEPERLRAPDDLQRFLAAHGFDPGEHITGETLEAVRELRAGLRACWNAETFEALARRLNPLLGREPVALRVEPDGDRLALWIEAPPDAALIERLAVACAAGLIALAQQHGPERLRSCAAEPCRDVFVDTSRNKSRRFCSDRCANRYNVAAFRERQKGSGTGEDA